MAAHDAGGVGERWHAEQPEADTMKIAMQLGLIPGNSVQDKQKWAADNGVDGIEISHGNYSLENLDQEIGRASCRERG